MKRNDFRIAVDAMGGDTAPEAPVRGAVWAAREYKQPIILVGDKDRIQRQLDREDSVPSSLVDIQDAPEVVGMHEPVSAAFKRKKKVSIRVAFELAKEGAARGVVSAGHSGATMAAAALILGRTEGVDRPALAGVFPSLNTPTVVIDVGANVNCKPQNLLEFGIMGNIYARHILQLKEPKVALLNVGEESSKGNDLVRRVHDLLSQADLNFVGNVEGRDVFSGKTQVIICDGFVGNVVLKLCEGMGQFMQPMMALEAKNGLLTRIAGFIARSGFKRLQKRLDYTERGGAPLLGVNGAGVICHGASPPTAVKNAIRVAADMVSCRVNERLAAGLHEYYRAHPRMNNVNNVNNVA